MSANTNDIEELKELRELKQMYQTRLDSKFDWGTGKTDKTLTGNYQAMLDSINKKIAKLENN